MQRRFMINGKAVGGGCSIERVNSDVLSNPRISISSYVDYEPDPIIKKIEIEFGEPNYAIKKYITAGGKFTRVELLCRNSEDDLILCGLYNSGWNFLGMSGYTSIAPTKCIIEKGENDKYSVTTTDELGNKYSSYSMTREKFLSIESFDRVWFNFFDINFQKDDKYEDYILFPNMRITYYL